MPRFARGLALGEAALLAHRFEAYGAELDVHADSLRTPVLLRSTWQRHRS